MDTDPIGQEGRDRSRDDNPPKGLLQRPRLNAVALGLALTGLLLSWIVYHVAPRIARDRANAGDYSSVFSAALVGWSAALLLCILAIVIGIVSVRKSGSNGITTVAITIAVVVIASFVVGFAPYAAALRYFL